MKRVAVLAAGLALFATGFLAACGGKAADSPSSSDTGTATTFIDPDTATLTLEYTLTFTGEKPTP
jgi:ABC-type glycerol-3-phosphate transport system substrate-binding protein